MPKTPKADPLAEIEKTQQALRENIEESKQLVEKTQKLLTKVQESRSPGS